MLVYQIGYKNPIALSVDNGHMGSTWSNFEKVVNMIGYLKRDSLDRSHM